MPFSSEVDIRDTRDDDLERVFHGIWEKQIQCDILSIKLKHAVNALTEKFDESQSALINLLALVEDVRNQIDHLVKVGILREERVEGVVAAAKKAIGNYDKV